LVELAVVADVSKCKCKLEELKRKIVEEDTVKEDFLKRGKPFSPIEPFNTACFFIMHRKKKKIDVLKFYTVLAI